MVSTNTNTIYLLRNKINDKVYVGQTWQTLKRRWCNGNGYSGKKIKKAIEIIGKNNL